MERLVPATFRGLTNMNLCLCETTKMHLARCRLPTTPTRIVRREERKQACAYEVASPTAALSAVRALAFKVAGSKNPKPQQRCIVAATAGISRAAASRRLSPTASAPSSKIRA